MYEKNVHLKKQLFRQLYKLKVKIKKRLKCVLYILDKSKRKHINRFVIDPENIIKSK